MNHDLRKDLTLLRDVYRKKTQELVSIGKTSSDWKQKWMMRWVKKKWAEKNSELLEKE
ncbi:hypothetical protein U1Q18_048388, partial [Sarracenia purpurea var. burkii]